MTAIYKLRVLFYVQEKAAVPYFIINKNTNIKVILDCYLNKYAKEFTIQ